MTTLTAEFTIEPFEPSAPGPHVTAAITTAQERASDHNDVVVDVGPFGTAITGPSNAVLEIVAAVNDAAISGGASRVSVQLTVA